MRTDIPLRLPANQPERAYRGGDGIAVLRGVDPLGDWHPEDFVASTTEVFSGEGVGLTRLPDGRLLRDAVAEDPLAYLGPEHVTTRGADSELLVKLLDPGERLFVHFHPDGEFARRELASVHGKTEAWIVVGVRPVDGVRDPHAYLGFARDVEVEEVDRWVADQDVDAMLAAMHRVPLEVGDTVYVPAGTPHAIGPGLTMVEVQEPTDLSILLEYDGFDRLDAQHAFLGLPRDVALSALDRRGLALEEIDALVTRGSFSAEPGAHPLLPDAAKRFFQAAWVRAGAESPTTLAAGFTVMVVLSGQGLLQFRSGKLEARRGDVFLIPFAVGAVEVVGDLSALACRPPA